VRAGTLLASGEAERPALARCPIIQDFPKSRGEVRSLPATFSALALAFKYDRSQRPSLMGSNILNDPIIHLAASIVAWMVIGVAGLAILYLVISVCAELGECFRCSHAASTLRTTCKHGNGKDVYCYDCEFDRVKALGRQSS
jgi:hypothetical protein